MRALNEEALCRRPFVRSVDLRSIFVAGYFLTIFLSCLGFLTSFFRTLFPLPIAGLLVVVSAAGTGSPERETFGGLAALHRQIVSASRGNRAA